MGNNKAVVSLRFTIASDTAPVGKPKWTEVGAKLECNGYDGEVYLESSRGKVPTLTECKESCESAQGCTSISYFKTGWCSHWSTPCKKTRWNKKAVASLQLAFVSEDDGDKSDGGKSDSGKSDGGKSDSDKSDGDKSDGGKSDSDKSDGGKSDS